jgi:hypothetical protein
MVRQILLCALLGIGCGNGADKKTVAETEAEYVKLKAEVQAEFETAQADVGKAKAEADQLLVDSAALQNRIDRAVEGLANARSQAERDAAKAQLDDLRVEKGALDARIENYRRATR